MTIKDIINDIDTVKEAIAQLDGRDAIQMLEDIQEDLKILSLIP